MTPISTESSTCRPWHHGPKPSMATSSCWRHNPMKRRWKAVLILIPLIICAIAVPSTFKYARRLSLKHEAQKIILKIEKYRAEKHKLPSNLEEIGISEDKEQIFYHPIRETNYVLSFDEEFGEFVKYDSS